MFFMLLLAALSLLLLCMWWQRNNWLFIWQLNGWRGFVQQPFLWLLILFFMDPKSILEAVRKSRKFFKRPLAIYLGKHLLFYVDDPEFMKQILNAPECMDKTFMQDGFFARKGLLHAKGLQWKIRRKQLDPTFTTNILLSFFPTFNAVSNRLQSKFSDLVGNKVNFKDVEDLLSRAVLDIACRKQSTYRALSALTYLLKKNFRVSVTIIDFVSNALRTTMGTEMSFIEHDEQDIASTYKKLLEISAVKIVKPWLQNDFLFRLVDRKLYECNLECNRLSEQFVNDIVQRKHNEWQQRNPYEISIANNVWKDFDDTDEVIFRDSQNVDLHRHHSKALNLKQAPRQRIFIEQIFHLAENGELTLQDIMDESHSMVLVAFETVSNSLLITLLLLAMHPECQKKLRQEIKQKLVSAITPKCSLNSPIDGPNNITNEHLKQLPYLDMVVNESMRLLTTVPMNSRNVSKSFLLKRSGVKKDLLVPAGTIIVLDNFNMQRDPKNWGSHSYQFFPEHFAESNSKEDDSLDRRHPYSFLPFSKGLRWCIGWRYSIWLTKILLIRLIQGYEFETTTRLQDLKFVEGISLKFLNSNSIKFKITKVPKDND